MMEINRRFLTLVFLFGVFFGGLIVFAGEHMGTPSDIETAREFYRTETALAVSPHEIRTGLESGETSFTLVDLRSAEEYEMAHIAGAVNIPGYSPDDTSPEAAEERIVSAFQNLPENKEIIMYCYSSACMLSRRVGDILAENGIVAKHLNIGWIEWKRDWPSWNTLESLEGVDPADYIVTGENPSAFKGADGSQNNSTCSPEDGGLGC